LVNETIEDACRRIAKKELDIKVKLIAILDSITIIPHPFAHPISILCHCKTLGEPKDGKYFTIAPKNMVGEHHRNCVNLFLKYIRNLQ